METERLIMRRFRKVDLQDLYEYLSDELGKPIRKDTFVYAILNEGETA